MLEIYFTDVPTFAGVIPFFLLPAHSLLALIRYTLIINTEEHTEPGNQWFAVHLNTRSSIGYYFDSYGHFPLVPAKRHFLRRNYNL